jgi:hypothetical protein
MSKIIRVKCTNIRDCGHVNIFPESELVGEVPLEDEHGNRLPPPPVEVDENTFVECEKCGYPIRCNQAQVDETK